MARAQYPVDSSVGLVGVNATWILVPTSGI